MRNVNILHLNNQIEKCLADISIPAYLPFPKSLICLFVFSGFSLADTFKLVAEGASCTGYPRISWDWTSCVKQAKWIFWIPNTIIVVCNCHIKQFILLSQLHMKKYCWCYIAIYLSIQRDKLHAAFIIHFSRIFVRFCRLVTRGHPLFYLFLKKICNSGFENFLKIQIIH